MSGRPIYQLGEWTVEPATNELRKGDECVQLDGKAMDVLAYLLAHSDDVVATDDILNTVWPDRVVEQSTVHRRINQIRQALGDDPKSPTYIRTIVRRGYQVVAPVSLADVGDSTANGAMREIPANPSAQQPSRRYAPWGGAILLILAAAGALLWTQQRTSENNAVVPRWQQTFDDSAVIAILPFRQTVTPGLEYLAPAVRNEISQRMHRLDSVTLVADYSAFKVVETTRDVREIGELLGADYVIEGYVRGDDDTTGVSINLSDTSSGLQVWHHEYQGQQNEVADIFELYDEIARALTVQLGIFMDRDMSDYYNPVPPPTGDIEAYNLVRRAFVARNQQRYADAIKLADQAAARDPGFYGADLIKAFSLWYMTENGQVNQVEGFTKARKLFEQVLTLAPDNAAAHIGLAGMAARLELDFRKSMRLYKEAQALGGPPRGILSGMAELYFNNGRYDESMALYQQVAEQDPLDTVPKLMIGRIYARTGDIPKARATLEEALRLAGPTNTNLNAEYLVLIANNDIERAQEIVAEAPDDMPIWYPSYVQNAMGNPEPRRAILKRLEQQVDNVAVSAWLISLMHYSVAQYDAHMDWFVRSIEEEGPNHFLYDHFYASRPDYWQNLQDWAAAPDDPAEVARRTARLDRHEQKVQTLMQNMWLD